MLIERKVEQQEAVSKSRMMKMAEEFLPEEQVRKFSGHDEMIEVELMNESREPEPANTLKDLFAALHDRNTPKLLRALQGDKQKIMFAYRGQLEAKQRLTKREAKVLNELSRKQLSLLTISTMKEL